VIAVKSSQTPRSHLAPLSGVRVEHGALLLGVTCQQVEGAVAVDEADEGYLSQGALHQFQHYQMKGSEQVEMVRSEEELRVGLRRQESGRVRLRKVVVSEEVTQTFTLSHEELMSNVTSYPTIRRSRSVTSSWKNNFTSR
jgi:hypothetical protein